MLFSSLEFNEERDELIAGGVGSIRVRYNIICIHFL
jgi:hypothetical protein